MPGKNSPEENAREESGASFLSEAALEKVLRDSIVSAESSVQLRRRRFHPKVPTGRALRSTADSALTSVRYAPLAHPAVHVEVFRQDHWVINRVHPSDLLEPLDLESD